MADMQRNRKRPGQGVSSGHVAPEPDDLPIPKFRRQKADKLDMDESLDDEPILMWSKPGPPVVVSDTIPDSCPVLVNIEDSCALPEFAALPDVEMASGTHCIFVRWCAHHGLDHRNATEHYIPGGT